MKLYRRDASEAARARIAGTVKSGETEVYELELGGRRGGELVLKRAGRAERLGNDR